MTSPSDQPSVPPSLEEIRVAPLEDGSEEDTQCARCGSSTTRVDCWGCGGEGGREGDDPFWDEGDWIRCSACGGRGGWEQCCSGDEWCKANPIPGRECIPAGTIEWFSLSPRKAQLENSDVGTPSDPSQGDA